jgi:hypothetical protein
VVHEEGLARALGSGADALLEHFDGGVPLELVDPLEQVPEVRRELFPAGVGRVREDVDDAAGESELVEVEAFAERLPEGSFDGSVQSSPVRRRCAGSRRRCSAS